MVIKQYNNRYACSRDSKNCGGGILLFVKKDIMTLDNQKSTSSFEKIKLKLKLRNMEVTLLSYYRPPVPHSFKPFIDDVEKELNAYNGNIIIIGDVNLDSNCDNSISSQYQNLLSSYDLKVTNNVRTRNISGRVIDHFAINFTDKTSISNHTINNSLSDHNIVISQLKGIKSVVNKFVIKIERNDYTKLRENFNELASQSTILRETNPDIIADELTKITQTAVKKSTKIINYKTKSKNLCEWLSLKILKAIRYKDLAKKKWRKNKSNNDLKRRLRYAENNLNHTIRSEKARHLEKIVSEGNAKKIWRNLNSLLGRKTKNSVKSLNIDNQIFTDESIISNRMNQQFIEGVNELQRDLNESTYPINMETILPSIILDDVTEDEVTTAIKTLKNSSSPGIDQIKPVSVKEISGLICPLITHLINRIFATGCFPKTFKTAIVTPVNKSGDFTNITDYRPISVLSTFSKLVEKVLYNKLYSFTNDYLNLIYNRQYGFRKKCGTEIAAVELVDHVSKAIDSKRKVSMVLMDIKKAFDMVNVDRLLDVLQCYGIRGNALKLIGSFLTDRIQIVKINSTYSNPIKFTRGVVQGSILGPYLFSLFINHIYRLSTNGTLFLFADDCILINEHDINESVEDKIVGDMRHIIH